MEDVVEREMTITHSDFWRVLRTAFPDEIISAGNDSVELDCNGGRVQLFLSRQTSRRMGALQLPVTTVTLAFDSVDAAGRQGFLKRFERSFQRGGG